MEDAVSQPDPAWMKEHGVKIADALIQPDNTGHEILAANCSNTKVTLVAGLELEAAE